jgi:hypothetical protein
MFNNKKHHLVCLAIIVFAGGPVGLCAQDDRPSAALTSANTGKASAPSVEPDDEPALAPAERGGAGKQPATQGVGGVSDMLHDLGLSGSLRGALWSSNRRFDDDHAVGVAGLWAKFDRKIRPGLGVFAEGYLTAENIFDHSQNTNRLREAYVDARWGQWDFRLGKQIVAWGRADRLNPTDNLTPRDFRLLVPEVDEDRFGSLAAKTVWNFTSSMSLTGVWLPDFQPNVFAIPPSPGVSIGEKVPGGSKQWALKLDQSGKAIDWSVSYFEGFDLNPDLKLIANSPTLTQLEFDHNRVKVLGFDAATSRGAYRFAVEGAYTRTEDPSGTNPYVKNPFFYGVFGVERTFGDNLTLIVQAFARQVEHFKDPNDVLDPAVRAVAIQQGLINSQYDKRTYGLSARIGKKWFNETLEGEFAGALLLNRTGYVLRPKLTYAYSDAIKFIGGVEYYGGSDKTSYGRLEQNRALFFEARYFF